jgi:hypothetical protein
MPLPTYTASRFGVADSHARATLQNSVALVRERTILSDRSLSAKLVSTFADRECRVVSATDP